MNAFYYLNYFIYRFYERRDADPFIYSLNGSSLLVLLNLMTIYYGLTHFFLKQEVRLGLIVVLVLLILIGVNYLILYKGNKYEKVFAEIRIIDNSTYQIVCFVYVIFSILSCLSVILLMKYQKYGSL
jgi:uncharacterized membrane-anchored protein